MQKKHKILIVDDEPDILHVLNLLLSEQYETLTASNGLDSINLAKSWGPDLILMDIMMPTLDGMSACKTIRQDEETRHIPVIFITALNDNQDRIRGFNLGADDFISKPFDSDLLAVRIASKLKRLGEIKKRPPEMITVGNLSVQGRSREVKVDDEILDLSPLEYGILILLLTRQNEVVSRNEIMEEVWEDQEKDDRLIDPHLTSLRKKINLFNCEIQTVYGKGYRLKEKTPA